MAQSFFAGWKDVLGGKHVGPDLLAGLTVAAVALPLNLALAVACEMPPIAGLVAGAIGGVIAAAFGGSPLQVSGPAAALSTMVLMINREFGAMGVTVAALIVGVVQVVMSLLRAGKLAQFVSEAVLAGFVTGVGLKLLDQQIPELLGFDYRVTEIAKMMHKPEWLNQVQWFSAVCGLFVAFLMVATRHIKRFPAAIVGVALATFVATYLNWNVTRVGEVPHAIPSPMWPSVPQDKWLDLFLAALPLALLASVESLLSASAVERMAPDTRKHQPNLELFGQGLGNIAVSLFRGMPVTGVIVRSGVNAQAGGRTRLSAIVHGAFLVVAILFLSNVIESVPLAALAGLLCVVGYRLLEIQLFIDLVRKEKVEALAFAVTCAGTVSGYLMAGLTAGLTISLVNRWLHGTGKQTVSEAKDEGVRAVLGKDRLHSRKRDPAIDAPASPGSWLRHVRAHARVPQSAFVHDKASLIGRVVLGENVHIAAGASVRADEGTPFFIGANSNVQDGVVIHALKEKHVVVGGEEWAVFIGRDVSLAHDALVHGPCFIGDHTFVGFKAVVHDSIIGNNCFVGIGATVVGVEVPDGRFVPHGAIVDTQDKVDRLGPTQPNQMHFNEDVVDVNRGLAAAYRAIGESQDAPRANVEGISRSSRRATWDEAWSTDFDSSRF